MKILVFLFWTFVLVEEESSVVEAMSTLVSTCVCLEYCRGLLIPRGGVNKQMTECINCKITINLL